MARRLFYFAMSFGLLLKKCIARIAFPVPVIGILLLAGIILVFSKREKRRKAGRILLIITAIVYYLAGVLGSPLLYIFANQYPTLEVEKLPEPESSYTICVAGSGFVPDEETLFASFNDHAQIRLLEAARLALYFEKHNIPYSVAVSVGNPTVTEEEKARAARSFFHSLNLPAEKIVVHGEAENSRDEIKWFKAQPGQKIIVTSTYHLPRFMMLAKKYDVAAIPAPAGAVLPERLDALTFIPSGQDFGALNILVYELLGMVEYAIF